MDECMITRLQDRAAIEACLIRYARGVDRIDTSLIRSAFWPDATDQHGTFNGNAHEFADYLGQALRRFRATSHVISNIFIEWGEDQTRVESYINAYHVYAQDEKEEHFILGGRYLDRFEKRDGEWRIAARLLVLDWLELPEDMAPPMRDHLTKIVTRGAAAPDDPWYQGAPFPPGQSAG